MSTISCPHCGVENPDGSAFCQECGKAVPSSSPTGPRVVTDDSVPSTHVGRTVLAGQLRKQAGNAAGALFVVAALHVAGGVLLYALVRGNQAVEPGLARQVLILNIVLAAVYAGLGFWGRVSPLPAAIVGLVLFVSVMVVNAVLDPSSIVMGIIVKVIVIVVLVKAISSGVKHKRLKEEMGSADGAAR